MMSSRRESHLLNFHYHHPNNSSNHDHHQDIPKGCKAIMVGQGEEQQRIIIPVGYINHPLFMRLLKEAEEEYGFDQKGTINIPCHLEEFRYVQGLIDKEIITTTTTTTFFSITILGASGTERFHVVD